MALLARINTKTKSIYIYFRVAYSRLLIWVRGGNYTCNERWWMYFNIDHPLSVKKVVLAGTPVSMIVHW